ncbi:unnamed protein product [Spirodela intermedia]|uniref:Uncharacterized protein n=1 Tax=Spirodela intermedia TaxID=51605 RepID=A0A7I8J6M4_SPIIN|nr:unnamed protein product [Spirodela intermedia]CAA6665694.1 unnamed protein product [Spirodela intermedia]
MTGRKQFNKIMHRQATYWALHLIFLLK